MSLISDVPLSTKATNILSYSQEKLGPLLGNIKELVIAKKNDAQTVVEERTSTDSN